jgi:hypothetical protein
MIFLLGGENQSVLSWTLDAGVNEAYVVKSMSASPFPQQIDKLLGSQENRPMFREGLSSSRSKDVNSANVQSLEIQLMAIENHSGLV